MSWTPPENYEPREDIRAVLYQGTPKVGTALFKVVMMVQHKRTPEETGMTPEQAREAIDGRIVPMELYPAVRDLASSDLERG